MDPSSSQTESLLKRLSGPSSGKAGLAKDQAEINKVIAEVSKGSKFYENEKRKDAELTVRIEKLLVLRDDLMKSARIAEIEALVDKQLAEIESQRDFSQIICHADMDAFYATVETLDNPSLEGTAFGVGVGVLCTASYEARKFGVRSGMATFVAKALCPHLNIIPMRFRRYSEMSDRVFTVLRKYDPNLLAAGCDEGYLNLTAACEETNELPDIVVRRMRDEVFEETGMTMSCGVAPNKVKMLLSMSQFNNKCSLTGIGKGAQVCSDLNKPNGQYIMSFDRSAVLDFTKDLPMRKTCGDVFPNRAQLYLLSQHNKLHLHALLCAHLGIHNNSVAPYARESRRSLGCERTFQPQRDPKVLLDTLDKIAAGLAEDCEQRGWAGKTLTLKYKLDTFQSFSRAKTLPKWTMTKEDILPHAQELLLKEFPLCLRLLGLRLTNLKDLREDGNTGLKRFWGQGGANSKVGSMKAIDEESDTDEESGLWEVDADGEPILPSGRTTADAANATSLIVDLETTSTKILALVQGKLLLSRGPVPLEKPSIPKRKRSASVGAKPSGSCDLRSVKPKQDSLPDAGLQGAKKIFIDVDSVCPNCLQELKLGEQHSASCLQEIRRARPKVKGATTTGHSKQPKITSLFNRNGRRLI
ncbi:DNA polymerase kappa subunit [Ceratobasidium theobromae]|uniref:DNA polymerase kappa n=1 Tax=Ceratobasidium theobromae TaxID=1582974 RepID=A0A5N5QTT4_9AGAM|nr:DNA polymerase kappa subunit [Ceratobasidium theobromae]